MELWCGCWVDKVDLIKVLCLQGTSIHDFLKRKHRQGNISRGEKAVLRQKLPRKRTGQLLAIQKNGEKRACI